MTDSPRSSDISYRVGSDPKVRVGRGRPHYVWCVLSLYGIHVCLAGYWGWTHAANSNEWAHLAAGVAYVSSGTLHLYHVNPPLTRYVIGMVARQCDIRLPVPASYAQVELVERNGEPRPERPEFALGRRVRDAYGERAWLALRLARLALVPLAASGILAIYFWSSTLLGRPAGFLAALFWALSPTAIAWSAALNPDACGAAALSWVGAALAAYLKLPRWQQAAALGAVFGLAVATKFTAIAALPWTIVTLAAAAALRTRGSLWSRALCAAARMFVFLFAAYVSILAAYASLPNIQRLASYEFVSQRLTALAQSPLGQLPALVPEPMLLGLDVQQEDLEHRRPIYVAGREHAGPVRWFYLYAWAVKEPPAAVVAAVLGAVTLIMQLVCRDRQSAVRFAATLGVPASVWVAVSLWGEFTVFYRYVLPGLPLAWLLGAHALYALGRVRRSVGVFVASLCVGSTAASVALATPHWACYFSEFVGGTEGGAAHLGGWALDWGQDVLWLIRWARRHPEARPVRLWTVSDDPLAVYGADESDGIVKLPRVGPDRLEPGWLAVSLGALHLADRSPVIRLLGDRPPDVRLGNIWLWHIEDSCVRSSPSGPKDRPTAVRRRPGRAGHASGAARTMPTARIDSAYEHSTGVHRDHTPTDPPETTATGSCATAGPCSPGDFSGPDESPRFPET